MNWHNVPIDTSTMTVGELIQKLKSYKPETPVFVTWEGVHAYVRAGEFKLTTTYKEGFDGEVLVIDVEYY